MDWISVIVGTFMVAWALWLPRSMGRIRARLVEREASTERWDTTMPRTIAIVRPLVAIAGVVAILAGILLR